MLTYLVRISCFLDVKYSLICNCFSLVPCDLTICLFVQNMRSNSAVVSSYLKSNASAAVASYSSTFVRDLCENDGCTYQFRARATGSQVGRNFALPRSRSAA